LCDATIPSSSCLKQIFIAHTTLPIELSWLELFPSSAYSKEIENKSYLDIVHTVKFMEEIIAHVKPLLVNQ